MVSLSCSNYEEKKKIGNVWKEESRHKKYIPSMDPQWHSEDPSLGIHRSLDIFGRKGGSHLERRLSKTDIFKWALDLLETSCIKPTPCYRFRLCCLEGAASPELWCFTTINQLHHVLLSKQAEVTPLLLQTSEITEEHWMLLYASTRKKTHFALN